MIRRHSRGSEQMHYGPALQTVTGNYVAGKRKGVIGGVDFGSTGMVILSPVSLFWQHCLLVPVKMLRNLQLSQASICGILLADRPYHKCALWLNLQHRLKFVDVCI